jgi:drug/metabolite transporter (DMT)-like permease
MIFGGVMLTAIGSATGEWHHVAFSTRSVTAFAYLIFVGSLVGYSAYIYTLKHLPVATISLYSYINPIIAVILGTVVAAEPFGLRSVVASAVVFAGVAVVRSKVLTAVPADPPVLGDENGARS